MYVHLKLELKKIERNKKEERRKREEGRKLEET